MTFDPTRHILARASADGTVILWDILDGTVPRLFEKHFFPVSSVGFEPNGRMLAIGSLDNTVKCASASKRDPAPSVLKGLISLCESRSAGSRSAPVGTPR